MPDPGKILNHINERHHTDYLLQAKQQTGIQGAYLVCDGAGREYILKWSDLEELTTRLMCAAGYTRALKRKGYPLPEFIHIGQAYGSAYSVQEKLPGRTCRREEVARFLPRILELNAMQEGMAEPGDWPARIVEPVLHGGKEFCFHEPLLRFSAATAGLLSALRSIAAGYDGWECVGSDIIHFDFHYNNILVNSSEISGVVDWQAPGPGDRCFDLLTMMLYTEPNSEAWLGLKGCVESERDPRTIRLYLSHLILRQIDWTIRNDPPTVPYWLGVAKRLLE